MRANNVLGIIFSNMHDEELHELTTLRTMGSVPFGGRYRMIDFTLSNMVNSGINKVGVVTKSNYQSLMDHLGSGKSWDLSRKRNGLYILPPFGRGNAIYSSRIEALSGISSFLRNSNEDYVMMTDCDIALNFDMQEMIERHIKSGVDITIGYKIAPLPKNRKDTMVLHFGANERITSIDVDPELKGDCCFSLNIYVMRRDLLEHLVAEAVSHSSQSFVRDIIQAHVGINTMMGYQISEYAGVVDSLASYFKVSMDLLKEPVRNDLFNRNRPVYTKVRDNMPTVYGLGSLAKNCFVADGCVIEGEVENSILFRGVHIGRGCKVKDCILIQGTEVGEKCTLSYVITDKNVIIKPERTLIGFDTYPVFIGKNCVV